MIRPMLSAFALAALAVAMSGCCGYRAMSDCGCGGGFGGGMAGCGGGCDSCGPTGPCGPLRSGGSFDRTYRVPRGPFEHLFCGGGCGEIYWGEWISDPPDACDPCDQCGNYTGDQCCPEWMRYTRFVPWGYRDKCGCGGGCGAGCGVMKDNCCQTCGMADASCGCETSMPVSYGGYRPGRMATPGCATCGH